MRSTKIKNYFDGNMRIYRTEIIRDTVEGKEIENATNYDIAYSGIAINDNDVNINIDECIDDKYSKFYTMILKEIDGVTVGQKYYPSSRDKIRYYINGIEDSILKCNVLKHRIYNSDIDHYCNFKKCYHRQLNNNNIHTISHVWNINSGDIDKTIQIIEFGSRMSQPSALYNIIFEVSYNDLIYTTYEITNYDPIKFDIPSLVNLIYHAYDKTGKFTKNIFEYMNDSIVDNSIRERIKDRVVFRINLNNIVVIYKYDSCGSTEAKINYRIDNGSGTVYVDIPNELATKFNYMVIESEKDVLDIVNDIFYQCMKQYTDIDNMTTIIQSALEKLKNKG